MNSGSEAILTFALAAAPGLIVLELLEYKRAPLRERSGTRAFAMYLFLSIFAWGAAVLLLGADERLAEVIDATSSGQRESDGQQVVSAYVELSWRLVAAAVAVGLALRLATALLVRYVQRSIRRRRSGSSSTLPLLGRLAAAPVSVVFAWDELLARLRRAGVPQVVHVRFRDGGDLYGVFAGAGRADFNADGRDFVLDAELVERNGQLVQIPGSAGVFVAADAVASVSFIRYSEPTGQLPSTAVQSSRDE